MNVLALEINDSGLLIGSLQDWHDAGPGYAMLDPEGLSLGEEARGQARLRPRRLNNRYWLELNTRPLASPQPYAGTAADLVCAQLADLWQRFGGDAGQLVLIVPGYLGSEALGLLLGIARECEVPVAGMVDTAVAGLAGRARGRRMLHLDAHLHLSLLTELEVGAEVRRGSVELIDGAGLAGLSQVWIDTVAAAFVHQTRFDPLHHAATEQSLFDQIEDWITVLGAGEDLTVQIEYESRPVAAQVGRRQMLEAAFPIYDRMARAVETVVAASGRLHLGLTHRLGRLPGLPERLARIEAVELIGLPPASALQGALRFREHVVSGDESVHFITALPAGDRPEPEPEPTPQADGDPHPRPTHLLSGAVAWEISDRPLTVGSAPPADARPVLATGNLDGISRTHCQVFRSGDRVLVEDHSRYGTFVNDRRIESRATLRAGDVLRVGVPGCEFLLVEART